MANVTMPQATASATGTDALASDAQLLRIRRLGKRLFKVAKCALKFDDALIGFHEGQQSAASIEAEFCDGLPVASALLVVPDASEESLLAQHPMVMGAPHIRFYAACPIYDARKTLVGSINLVDYKPRTFSENDRLALVDLAGMVERELYLRSLNTVRQDLEKKNRNLRRKSLIDPLIGTWNRGAIMRILAIEAVRCDRMGVPLSVIVLDLDLFKRINDTYGHPAGDAVLVKVTSRLRSCVRPLESLGRYGGEEFLVVLPGSPHEVARSVAERMRLAVASEPELIDGTVVQLTISAGVSSTDIFPAASTDELINRADKALYAAKDGGRNCVMQAQSD